MYAISHSPLGQADTDYLQGAIYCHRSQGIDVNFGIRSVRTPLGRMTPRISAGTPLEFAKFAS
jgi:hypothetical protein